MTETPLLIHIGYHKTATTWMQTRLLVPENGYRQLFDHRDVHDTIIGPHGLTFDPSHAQSLISERAVGLLPDEVPVISSEILSGQPFGGGRESDDFARRLALIAPGSKILISIRAQMKILPSIYMQYLLRGGTMPMQEFFFGHRKVGFFGFDPAHFEYHRLVSLYQSLFGSDNVHILQQERLREDSDGAAIDLAAFCGNSRFVGLSDKARAAHPPSYPENGIGILRRVNHFQRSPMNHNPVLTLGHDTGGAYRLAGYLIRRPPVSLLLGKRRPVTDFVARHFAGRFDDSNRVLAEISASPLDLKRY